MDGTALVRRIKGRGAQLGLAAVGIAPLLPSDHARFLRDWLASGYAGRMSWMERTARDGVDLRRRLSWARSAVVTALPYLPYRGPRHSQPGILPHVARYALGRDYHETLKERLDSLARFIEKEAPGSQTRVYVDTGPVLERELAARAGLGWFGKNTNLIGPRGDSWTLLGQVLTSLDLPADTPAADHCGSCTACLDACPTAAILEPYLLDASRCVSYLTIELRDAIPRHQRQGMGDWVFGCDVCQEVCPWNRRVEPTQDAEFHPGPSLCEGDLRGLVGLDQTSFRERFTGTPLARPRRRGLVRNALVVAANTRNEPALDAARERLADDDPVVRGAAAWALGRAGGGRNRGALRRALAAERDQEVRSEIGAALEDPGQESPVVPSP